MIPAHTVMLGATNSDRSERVRACYTRKLVHTRFKLSDEIGIGCFGILTPIGAHHSSFLARVRVHTPAHVGTSYPRHTSGDETIPFPSFRAVQCHLCGRILLLSILLHFTIFSATARLSRILRLSFVHLTSSSRGISITRTRLIISLVFTAGLL